MSLPPHGVIIPLRRCVHCERAFLAHNKTTCSEECRRGRANRQAADYIMRRYRTEPEFRDRMISAVQNRRADRLGLEGITSPKTLISYLMDRDRGICGICYEPVDETEGPMRPSIDHIIPLARGGLHEIGNLQIAHYRCNLRKGAKVQVDGELIVET